MDSDACVCSESEFYNPEEEAFNQKSLCFSSIISFVSLAQFQKRELFKKKMKAFFTSFNQSISMWKKEKQPLASSFTNTDLPPCRQHVHVCICLFA